MDPLFGSETRAGVLDQLARTPHPQSAYRVAKAIGSEPIQVLRILKGLGGLVEHTDQGWVLRNDLLREFMRDRSALLEDEIRREKDELLVRFGLRPSLGYGRH